jgi:hypothetical protein
VLLCLAAPDWQGIPACVPPIQQVLQDLARGQSFPSCAMAGAGNSARQDWASGSTDCPPQYIRFEDTESGQRPVCGYQGVITVAINGLPFTRIWWNLSGDTVTEFSAAAKAQLGQWNTRFDADYAAWLAQQSQPGPAPVESGT